MNRALPTVLSLLVFAGLASADELFLFVTNTKSPYPAQLMGYGVDGIDIIDPVQGHVTIPEDECIVFLRPTAQPDLSGTAHVRLKDGQVFIGQPGDSGVSETCRWIHPRLGRLSRFHRGAR